MNKVEIVVIIHIPCTTIVAINYEDKKVKMDVKQFCEVDPDGLGGRKGNGTVGRCLSSTHREGEEMNMKYGVRCKE